MVLGPATFTRKSRCSDSTKPGMLTTSAYSPSNGRNMMPKFVVAGTERYFSEISLASSLIWRSKIFLAAVTAAASPSSSASRRCSYASPGNLESIGRSTGSPPSTGIFTANSTRSRLSGTVATSSRYWSGVRISRRIAPSCTSPKMPRVFTFESTRLRSPTPEATSRISPNPRETVSSWSVTCLNDELKRSFSVRESFSSTVSRMRSSCRALSSRMAPS